MANHESYSGALSLSAAVAGDTYTVGIPSSGLYIVAVSATGYGSTGVVVNLVMPDGSTLLPLASFTSNGSVVNYLPQGKVVLAVDGSATVVQIILSPVSRT